MPEGPRPAAASFFDWPTGPSWLYALTQGLHTNVGLVAIPFLLAKLWSVIPRLFAFPPVNSPAQAIERLSIALLVSSAVFELATGVMNAQYWYPFKFNFVVAHYYGAIVFVASLVLHVIVKVPVIRAPTASAACSSRCATTSRTRGPSRPTSTAGWSRRTRPSRRSRAAACSRSPARARGLLLVANVGQSVGGPLRKLAFLAPRREHVDGDFPINKRAAAAGRHAGDDRRGLPARAARGDAEMSLSRDELLALPQRTAQLPIACVEGWSSTQEWTGVPLVGAGRARGRAGRERGARRVAAAEGRAAPAPR